MPSDYKAKCRIFKDIEIQVACPFIQSLCVPVPDEFGGAPVLLKRTFKKSLAGTQKELF
jgi:hypothetical protein